MSSWSVIGEGSIYAVSGAAKVAKTTSAYGESSILPAQSPEDYGYVQDSPLDSDNYGLVSQSELIATVDNRYIYYSTTATPYGLGQISGAATNIDFKVAFRHIASGTLNFVYTFIDTEQYEYDAYIQFIPDYQGRGTLSALNGSAESFGPRPKVDTDEAHTRLYEVVGIGGEKNTFSYNEKSIVLVQSGDDFGTVNSVPTSSDDYGLISQNELVAANDYRYIYYDDIAYPYGTISVSGESLSEVITAFRHISTGGIEVFGNADIRFRPDYQGRGTLSALSGSAESFGPRPPVDTEEVHTRLYEVVGIAGEKNTFSYNEKSILLTQSGDDYGTIASSPTSSDDYGSVSQNELVAANDYRYIYYDDVAYPFGTISIGGESVNEVLTAFRHVATGGPEVSGNADIKFRPDYQGRGTLSAISGSADSLIVDLPIDEIEESIKLFELDGTKVEKTTYSYNEYAVVATQSGDDFGSIASAPTGTEDYGSIGDLEFTQPYEDRRYIYFNDVAYPYGTIKVIGGASEAVFESALRYSGAGTAEISGSAGVKFRPDYQGRGTLSAISGSAESTTVNPPDQTILFEISGTKIERNTFSYNERSIFVFDGFDDLGQVGSGTTSTDDYGSVNDSAIYTDNGSIQQPFNQTTYPYGTIEISGSAAESTSPSTEIGSGSAEFSGIKIEKSIFSEVGSGFFSALGGSAEVVGANPPDQTILFEISGTKIERNTFSYNERSIFVFDGFDDLGQVGAGTTTTDDYGSVNDSAEYTDNGSIQQPFNQTTYPYGTVKISGSATEKDTETFIADRDLNYNLFGIYNDVRYLLNSQTVGGGSGFGGSGGFNIGSHAQLGLTGYNSNNYFGEKVIEFRPIDIRSFNTISIVYITGSGSNGGTYVPYSSVIEYNIGFGWSTLAILPLQFSLNKVSYALPTPVINAGDKAKFRIRQQASYYSFYGPVLGVTEIEFSNVQTATQPNTVRPVTFGGNRVEKSIFREVGSGSLTAFNGSAESFGANPPENIVLFDVSGTKVEKSTFSEIGSGTAIISGSATESTTPATEIGSGSAEFSGAVFDTFRPDYQGTGSFSAFGGAAEVSGVNPPDQTVFFEISGSAAESFTSTTQIGSGSAEFTGIAPNVYNPGTYRGSGSAEFSGAVFDTFRPDYQGTGTLSALNGSAESFGANPPENIVLFDVSGVKIEKSTFREIFSGTIEASGTKVEKSTFREIGSGSASISGSAAESTTPATEIGSGSFSAFGGAAEVSGVNPPDQTLLFEISGGYNNLKATFAHEGTGTAVFSGQADTALFLKPRITGFGDISISSNVVLADYARTLREIGTGSFSAFGGAAESTGANPPENIALYQISGGYDNLKATFAHEGTGTINVSGTGVDRFNSKITGSGTINISGSAAESITPATEIGSGSFSAFGGSAEVFGVNPPDQTVLFKIAGGISDIKAFYAHNGTGTINILGNATDKFVSDYVGSGVVEISGSAAESFTPTTEIGSGSFSAFGGSAESVGANPPDQTLLFEISGGYNNLKATFAYEGTGTINVSGSALEKYLPNNVGFGRLSAVSGSAESTTVNPPDQTVLFSFSGTKRERIRPGTAVGSGFFSAFGGGVIEFGANPPENIALFDVSGVKVEKSTFREIGSGSASIFGSATESFTPATEIGSGSAEFSGTKVEKSAFAEVGSGSLTAFGGHVIEFGANPPENIALFDVSGAGIDKAFFKEIGSGSFSAFGGGAESTGSNPPDQTVLFEISGTKIEKSTFTEVGSGSFSAFGGHVIEFGVNPPDNIALFDVSGTKVEKSTFREIGSGSITISGTMTQRVQVYVPYITGSGNIGISVTSRERFASDNRGTTDPIFSDTLGVFVGGDPTITGQVNHSFSHTTYIASGNIDIVGISTTRIVEYRAPYVFVTII